MRTLLEAVGLIVGLALLCCGRPGPACAGAEGSAQNKFALLVGCTEYQHMPAIPELFGPANDVPKFAELLVKKFDFAEKNITRLVGWPKDLSARPTYANIVAGFEDLLRKADNRSQIVILLSGHGSQIPIPETQLDPLDPKNPEPDGLDEIFLPADVRQNGEGRLEGYIIDDQIGAWLDRFRAKGASVWIIFDCCHSGTMDRGGPDDVERSREVKAEALGVPHKAMEAAIRRGAEAVRKAREQGRDVHEDSSLALSPTKDKQQGSVVAFYAAQSFEKAPELPRPLGAARTKENYFGMLSYSLMKVLSQQQRPLTYRELSQAVVGLYQSERGARGPTPFADGDLDREVLGAKVWPKRSLIVLQKEKMEINAGEISGLTPGSVLAVHSPATDKTDAKAPLGHVQVVRLTPSSAQVVPCSHAGQPAPQKDKLPDQAPCRLVSRDFGDMKIRIAVGKTGGTQAALLGGVLKKLDSEVLEMVRIVADEAEAEWILIIHKDEVQLRMGDGRKTAGAEISAGTSLVTVPKVFAICPAHLQAEDLAQNLSRDLQRIFTWQNLWRIAGSLPSDDQGAGLGFKFEVARLTDAKEDGLLVSGAPVQPGQGMLLKFGNDGINALWINILLLDANFGIKVVPIAVQSGKQLKLPGKVDGKTAGKEGIIVLAGVLAPNQDRPDFSFLDQPPLKVGRRDVPDITRGPETPFGRLMAAARLGKGTRSFEFNVPTNPVMRTFSWVAVTPNPIGK
jgi:hypothetical protein